MCNHVGVLMAITVHELKDSVGVQSTMYMAHWLCASCGDTLDEVIEKSVADEFLEITSKGAIVVRVESDDQDTARYN